MEHKVYVLSFESVVVRAHVRGTKLYTVLIEPSSNVLFVSCDCPHFARGVFCKHIFATLLACHQVKPDKFSLGVLERKLSHSSDHSGKKQKTRPDDRFWDGWFKSQQKKSEDRGDSKSNFGSGSHDKDYRSSGAGGAFAIPNEFRKAFMFFESYGEHLQVPLSQEVLRKAKNRIMMKIHPDHGGSTQDAAALNSYTEALIRNIHKLQA